MAARLNTRQAEMVKEHIKTTQLVKRLQSHVLGSDENPGEPLVELSATQLKAIEILLRKTLPDLAKTELTGDDESPLSVQFVIKNA